MANNNGRMFDKASIGRNVGTLALMVATISTSVAFLLRAMPDIPIYGWIAGPAFPILAFIWYWTFTSDKDIDGDGFRDTPSQKRLALFMILINVFTDVSLTLAEIFIGALSLFRAVPITSLNNLADWGILVSPATLALTGVVLVANLIGFMAYGIIDDIFDRDVLELRRKPRRGGGGNDRGNGGNRPAFTPQAPRPQQPANQYNVPGFQSSSGNKPAQQSAPMPSRPSVPTSVPPAPPIEVTRTDFEDFLAQPMRLVG